MSVEPRKHWRDVQRLAPAVGATMLAMEKSCGDATRDHGLIELVKVRVSQINGCAFCQQMHAQAAKRAGLGEHHLVQVAAWRQSSLFSPRERSALAWAEALTCIADGKGVDDACYDAALAEFGDAELAHLSLCVASINMWNRIAVGYNFEPPASAT
jgi:AhpD family alkylhydroperoxidase